MPGQRLGATTTAEPTWGGTAFLFDLIVAHACTTGMHHTSHSAPALHPRPHPSFPPLPAGGRFRCARCCQLTRSSSTPGSSRSTRQCGAWTRWAQGLGWAGWLADGWLCRWLYMGGAAPLPVMAFANCLIAGAVSFLLPVPPPPTPAFPRLLPTCLPAARAPGGTGQQPQRGAQHQLCGGGGSCCHDVDDTPGGLRCLGSSRAHAQHRSARWACCALRCNGPGN